MIGTGSSSFSSSAKRYEVPFQDALDQARYLARSLATGISRHKYMTGLRKKSFSAPVHMKRNKETTRLENPRGESQYTIKGEI